MGGLLKLTHKESGGEHREKTGAILDKIESIINSIWRQVEDDRKAHIEPERS
jgi:hypothetical protein